MKDMSLKQFNEALERHGMIHEGFMGYVRLNVPGHHIAVSMLNAGSNRRVRLAYLLEAQERELERLAKEAS